MKKTIPLDSRKAGALVLVLALGLAMESASADLVFRYVEPLPEPINTPGINSGDFTMTSDGLEAYFVSINRPGGYGGLDLWMTTRATVNDAWEMPVNLGPTINSQANEAAPTLYADGLTLYFRSQGILNQVAILPIVDLNDDGIVDAADMCIIVDHWGTDNSLCDIGPMPWGDGIVDVQDLIILAEHLFDEIPMVEPAEPVE